MNREEPWPPVTEQRAPKRQKRSPTTLMDLSLDALRYHLLPFCEIPSLLRLNWTNTVFRALLNKPETVAEWQSSAWYLRPRGCDCERFLFLLDVPKLLDFSWDLRDIHTLRHADVALRSVGRSVAMYSDPRRIGYRMPYVDPRRQPMCFSSGIMGPWYSGLIIPMPRMTKVPVEDTRVRDPLFALDASSPPSTSVTFWRTYHQASEEEGYDSDATTLSVHSDESGTVNVQTETQPPSSVRATVVPNNPAPGTGFLMSPSEDLVVKYVAASLQEGRDPYDPNQDDDEQSGYHAVQYARRRLFETPVGVQTYPLDLCIPKSMLRGRAYRQGVDYVDMSFLPVFRRNNGMGDESSLLNHVGLTFFHPVRYENERGDFVCWALSHLAVVQAVYQYLWYDTMQYMIRRLYEFTHNLAREVETDMSTARLVVRWRDLQRTQYRMQADWPFPKANEGPADILERRRMHQNVAAGSFMRDPMFYTFHRYVGQCVEDYENGRLPNISLEHTGYTGYLTGLLPSHVRLYGERRSHEVLVQELHHVMHVADYVVQFAQFVAPLTDMRTTRYRQRTLSCYLGACTSLLMFAPGWRRMMTWEPSATGTNAGDRMPWVLVQNSHRYQYYLDFLNRRSNFYHPSRFEVQLRETDPSE